MEVFMLRRNLNSDFVGGAYVFPGGAVDEADRHAEQPEPVPRGHLERGARESGLRRPGGGDQHRRDDRQEQQRE